MGTSNDDRIPCHTIWAYVLVRNNCTGHQPLDMGQIRVRPVNLYKVRYRTGRTGVRYHTWVVAASLNKASITYKLNAPSSYVAVSISECESNMSVYVQDTLDQLRIELK